MSPAIELNIGHVPSPRSARGLGDDGAPGQFRIVVLADFSGAEPGARPPLPERPAVRVDIDNADAVFARFSPSVRVDGLQDTSGRPLRIQLESMADFEADAVLARLPALASAPWPSAHSVLPPVSPAAVPLADVPLEEEDAAATLRRLLGGSVPPQSPARSLAAGQPGPAAAIDNFIRQLVAAPAGVPVPAPTPAPAAAGSTEAAAALLRHVLRDPAWRHLECAWRSVDRFVRELDMADNPVRLELVDCRADELLADLVAAGGDSARASLGAVLRGDGGGCAVLVSLEEFGASLGELSLLGGLAALAAAHAAVLLAGAAPALAAVASSDDAGLLAQPGARAWHALRESALAPRLGLTFPRLLARLPYGPRNDPVAAFPFDEIEAPEIATLHETLLWRSAALDAALLLARGYAEAGDAGVEMQVQMTDLPAFVDRSGDEPRLQAVAERYLGEGEAGQLARAGFIVLQSDRRVPSARVGGWRSIAAGGAALAGSWRET